MISRRELALSFLGMTFLQKPEELVINQFPHHSWVVDDARLLKKISIERYDILTGDLVRLISEATGISLSCDSQYSGDGIQLTCLFKDQTVFEVLSAISSALSYRNAEFSFQRSLTKPFTYSLVRSKKNSLHTGFIQQKMRDSFIKYTNAIINYSQSNTDETIESNLKSISAKRPGYEEEKLLSRNLSYSLKLIDTDTANLLRLLSKNTQINEGISKILDGKPLVIPRKNMSDDCKKILQKINKPITSDDIMFYEDPNFHTDYPGCPIITSNLFPDAGFGGITFELPFLEEVLQM